MRAPAENAASAQASFAAALLAFNSEPCFATMTAGGTAARRFAIYRNNVVSSLAEALAARFPVCRRLVGDELFFAMARLHARLAPPRSPVMAAYGAAFADFIDVFPPTATLSYLADVARLEHAVGRAYHAADAVPVTLAALRSIPEERRMLLTLTLHPSVNIVTSPHPIVSIWRNHADGGEVNPVDMAVAEDALVLRPFLAVDVHLLPRGAAAFIKALQEGASLMASTEATFAANEHFDLAASLAMLVSSGSIVAATLPAG